MRLTIYGLFFRSYDANSWAFNRQQYGHHVGFRTAGSPILGFKQHASFTFCSFVIFDPLTSRCHSGFFSSIKPLISTRPDGSKFFASITSSLARNMVASSTFLVSTVSHTTTSSSPGLSSGNIVVPSLISTYCSLGNPSLTTLAILSSPSLVGSRGAVSSGSLCVSFTFCSPPFLSGSSISSTSAALGIVISEWTVCGWSGLLPHS